MKNKDFRNSAKWQWANDNKQTLRSLYSSFIGETYSEEEVLSGQCATFSEFVDTMWANSLHRV
ncbi:MAG: hypothetical protein KA368_24110 [Acidobacteria bacterium]|nr:hypothetical protein [Acidobacteriota bacterium]